jgi:hypothetical protein
MNRRKVILLEFNEINWRIIDPLMGQGKLPEFARLRAEGVWGTPVAIEQPPHLDPWVTWVTLHTGVPQSEHGATILEQSSESIRAPRTWDYAIDAGKSVGVFGSISAYPPRPVPGFMVPGPFAPDDRTYPDFLRPMQALNRRYTRVHNKLSGDDSLLDMIKQGADLFSLGLRPATVARVAAQLATERVRPHLKWKRVSLQPRVNCDFFSWLYRRYKPEFATWHTNHAAHYMHHHWRAHDDAGFPVKSSDDERRKYGAAVRHGYEVCDEILGHFRNLAGDDTVLVVASSMGQQPYVSDVYEAGRVIVRFKDVQKVLDIVGARGVAEVIPIMQPQVNVRIPDANERARVRDLLRAARRAGGPHDGAMSLTETGDTLTLSPSGLRVGDSGVRYTFPGAPGADPAGYPLEALFAADTPTTKQGMHDPHGILMMVGPGIRKGVDLGPLSNLDVAPTLLSLMGVRVPPVMKGRVLAEAWGEAAAHAA